MTTPATCATHWSADQIKASKGVRTLAMVTAYDTAFARMAQAAEMDMILVGDSAANVMFGLNSTREIGIELMVALVAAVRRGAPHIHVVADMPYGSDCDTATALAHAQQFLAVGADSVKIEGARTEIIAHLVACNIPVVGHLGLLPQTATSFRQRGRDAEEAREILRDAHALQSAGICALVLEHVPESLGAQLAQGLSVPVIGIGAGAECDGQVLVLHDLLGMHPHRIPPFAKRYADVFQLASSALRNYADDVRAQRFPESSHDG